MVKKLLIGIPLVLLLLLAGFAVVVAMQPSEFRLTRSAQMAAPPEKVFEQVNDFHNWGAWSPWTKLDPDAKISFDGPSAGKGARFSWVGNENMGEGSMEILESRPHELIRLNLKFVKPMQDTALTEFAFQPAEDQTVVTWTMSGENNFMEKAVCMFMNMDQVVGGSFEEGLANIKKIVEAEPQQTDDAAVPEEAAE